MIKKMVHHGNSSALIIDKSIMELLNIDSAPPGDFDRWEEYNRFAGTRR